MLNARFVRLLWGSLAAISLILTLLLLLEYQSVKAQTARLAQLQDQYQTLNQQLTSALARQSLRTRIAEKKSAYST